MADKKSKSGKDSKKPASKPKMSKKNMEKAAGAAAILAALGLGAYGVSKTEKGKAVMSKAKEQAGYAKVVAKSKLAEISQKAKDLKAKMSKKKQQ